MRKTCDKKMFFFDMYRETEEQVEEIDGVMDWEFKEFSWETNDLEQKENGDLSALVEFGRLERKYKKAESLVDMKFQVSDSVDGLLNKSKDFKSTTSKSHNGTRKPCCLVDGCKADLSNCREYHKRHRVCERHSKTPTVTIKGEEKRFCQQCSRFHSLGEFDEGKRSCRKRLDGHNRRRRKTQPQPFYWSSKNFMSSYKGPRILQFGSPHMYAAPTVENMWPLNTKTEASPLIGDPIQGNYTSGPLNLNNTPKARSIGSQVFPSEAITLPIYSGDCALYLLSSNQTQTSEMTFNQWVQSNLSPSIQPLDSSRRFNSGFANLVEYPFPCIAKEQANWESIANF